VSCQPMASWTRCAVSHYRFSPDPAGLPVHPRGGVMAPDDKVKLPRIRIRKGNLPKLGLDEELHLQGEDELIFELEQPDLSPSPPGTLPEPPDQLGNR
jgi:hypothetical protein